MIFHSLSCLREASGRPDSLAVLMVGVRIFFTVSITDIMDEGECILVSSCTSSEETKMTESMIFVLLFSLSHSQHLICFSINYISEEA